MVGRRWWTGWIGEDSGKDGLGKCNENQVNRVRILATGPNSLDECLKLKF